MSERTIAIGPDAEGRVIVSDRDRVRLYAPTDGPAGAALRIPLDGGSLRPGWVNAHTHMYSGLAPLGMPPPTKKPTNFLEILERVWWRLDRALDEASLRASARYYVAESLLAGTTTLIDHHESPNFIEGSLGVLAEACQELGVRALLCFGVTERNGGRPEATRGLAECERFIKTNRRPLVRGAVALHASFTVSDETIHEAGRMARELDSIVHVHVAEDGADVDDARSRGHSGPLERLMALEALPAGSILAHGVHCDASQVARAEDAGLWFVQNPRSNRGNKVGYPAALGASRHTALGTDGYPARMDTEAKVLLDLGAKHGEAADTLTARIEAGHRLASELFGLRFAPLQPGGAFDVVALDERGSVKHVFVDGRQVVENGCLTTGDLAEIRRQAEIEAARLWQRMSALD